ncbi:hypothetical protein E4U42_001112 [Claviceps africana]|uniref:Methyltransferase FkbM domain-containing protein n=1 Tax=Claviceps africana TaxID=83212 RepID=A0A8K0J4Q5_9HYPO|nr:hypothetical protein E4U42_001112 [Claviceps africana]
MTCVQKMQLADDFSVYANAGAEFETRFIYKEIFRDGCYDVGPLPADAVVVDAGANIGLFSLYIKGRIPGARVTAFEPAPETAGTLRRNLALHGRDDVTVHECALGERDCAMTLTYFPNMPGNSSLNNDGIDAKVRRALADNPEHPVARLRVARRPVEVAVRRLSGFLRDMEGLDRIDLLKIDVEGAEMDVLAGLDDEHWALVRNLVLEICDIDNAGRPGAVAAAEKMLEARGFRVARQRAEWATEDLPMYTLTARRE